MRQVPFLKAHFCYSYLFGYLLDLFSHHVVVGFALFCAVKHIKYKPYSTCHETVAQEEEALKLGEDIECAAADVKVGVGKGVAADVGAKGLACGTLLRNGAHICNHIDAEVRFWRLGMCA